LTALLAGILAYVACQLAVGVFASRRIKSDEDFFVAGRRLGPGLAAISVFATWFGAETCVGAAGGVHAEGLSLLTVEPFGYGLCLLATGLVIAAPLWRRGVITLADFFRARFGGGAERVAAVALLPSSVFWAAAQVRAFAEVLVASGDGLSLAAALALAAGIAVLYTALGGLLADVWTDSFQAGVLTLGLLLVLGAVVVELGGLSAAAERLAAAPVDLSLPEGTGWLDVAEAWLIPILGSLTAQEVLARSFAARSAGVARAAGIGGGLLYLAIGAVPVLIGLLAPAAAEATGDSFLAATAQRCLSPLLYVLFAGALVSAILSTVDSALLVASSLLTRNFVRGKSTTTPRRALLGARVGVAAAGVAAWHFARTGDGVMALVERASAFGSAGIVVAVLAGLATRRGGQAAAIGALLAGTATWVVGEQVEGALRYPFLTSVAAAALAFAAAAAWQGRARA